MGRHIISRGKSGEVAIQQIDERRAWERDMANLSQEERARISDGVPGTPAAVKRDQMGEQPSPALDELVAMLYQRNGQWARTRIARLATPEELRKVQDLEINHPTHQGGRPAVLTAITDRLLAIAAPEAVGA